MKVMLTTPKEKAENLVEMFMNIESNKLSDYSRIYHPTAKICAILLVNEIILANPHSNPFNTNLYSTTDYWFKVEEEIKKL